MEAGFLRRGLEELKLRPKSFEVLTYLVEHHGRLVTKRALMDSIWSDTATTDNSLAQCMTEIRQALNDDSQTSIRTIARRGYVFAAPVITTLRDNPRQLGDNLSELSPWSAGRAYPLGKHQKIVVISGLLALTMVLVLVTVWRSRPTERR